VHVFPFGDRLIGGPTDSGDVVNSLIDRKDVSPIRRRFVVRFLQTMCCEKHLLCQEASMNAGRLLSPDLPRLSGRFEKNAAVVDF